MWQTSCNPSGNSLERIVRLRRNSSPSDWHIRLQYVLVESSACRIHWASGNRLACISIYCLLFSGYSWRYKEPEIHLQVLVHRFLISTEVLLPHLLTECHQVCRKGIGGLILFDSEVLLRRIGWPCLMNSPLPYQRRFCTTILWWNDLFPIVFQNVWWLIPSLPDDLFLYCGQHPLFYEYSLWWWGNRVVSEYLFLWMYWFRHLLHCHSVACMIFVKTRQEYGWGCIAQVWQNVREVFVIFVLSHLHPASRQIYLYCLPIYLLVAFVLLRILLLFYLAPIYLPDNQFVILLLDFGLWQCVFEISMIWWFGLPFLFRHCQRAAMLICVFLLHPYSLQWYL